MAIFCSSAGQNSRSHYFTSRAFCILTRATSPFSGHEAALSFNLYKCQECLEEKERAWTKGTGCNNDYESEKKNPVIHGKRDRNDLLHHPLFIRGYI